MKVKIEELAGVALRWAAAKALGETPVIRSEFLVANGVTHDAALKVIPQLVDSDETKHPLLRLKTLPDYPGNWALAGAILEEEGISVKKVGAEGWVAKTSDWVVDVDGDSTIIAASGQTPGVAIVRCFVCMKLGYEVEIPEVLS